MSLCIYSVKLIVPPKFCFFFFHFAPSLLVLGQKEWWEFNHQAYPLIFWRKDKLGHFQTETVHLQAKIAKGILISCNPRDAACFAMCAFNPRAQELFIHSSVWKPSRACWSLYVGTGASGSPLASLCHFSVSALDSVHPDGQVESTHTHIHTYKVSVVASWVVFINSPKCFSDDTNIINLIHYCCACYLCNNVLH